MSRKSLEEAEARIMELVVKRRQLGGFDVNAEAILIIAEDLLKVIGYIRELPEKK